MSTLHFIHGSKAIPDKPENFRFNLYNYLVDPNKVHEDLYVNSGLDAEGPGIYAFKGVSGQFNHDDVEVATGYIPTLGGSLIGFSIDTENDDGEPIIPANEQPVDAIPEETWVEVVEIFMSKLRQHHNFDEDDIQSAAYDACELLDSYATEDAIEQALQKVENTIGNGFTLRECHPSDFDSPDEWYDAIIESSQMYDPARRIIDEGGAEDCVSYAMRGADSLWGMTKNLFNLIAVNNTGKCYESYNRLFLDSVKACVDDMSILRYADVNNGAFQVVFDVDAITVEAMNIHRTLMPEDTQRQLLDAVEACRQTQISLGLETEQIAMAIRDICSEQTQRTPSLDVCRPIARLYPNETIPKELAQQLIREVSARNVFTWERQPGAWSAFNIAQEQDNKITLSRRR